MNVSNEAIKLGQTQVEFDCLYGNRTDLTTKELTEELLRICSRKEISYKGYDYLENKLITERRKEPWTEQKK